MTQPPAGNGGVLLFDLIRGDGCASQHCEAITASPFGRPFTGRLDDAV
jgi:hypothetical protein